MPRFEIREGQDSLGPLLGVVEAEIIFRAAEQAAVKFFGGAPITRETGWGGSPGSWRVGNFQPTKRKPAVFFWVGPESEEVRAVAQPAPSKPKRRKVKP